MREDRLSQARIERHAERMAQLADKGFSVGDASDYLSLTYLAQALKSHMSREEWIRYQSYKAREQAIDNQSKS